MLTLYMYRFSCCSFVIEKIGRCNGINTADTCYTAINITVYMWFDKWVGGGYSADVSITFQPIL